MKKAIFILGPTAVGKTALAFDLAAKIPSILISADSIQVYKGLDVISGKDIPTSASFHRDHYVLGSSEIYLLDVVSAFESFHVRNFLELSKQIISKAIDEGKTPIIVGGTGFYADALFKNIETVNILPDEQLRKELKNLSVVDLQNKLKKIDLRRYEKMNESDSKNKRRLERAIEIAYGNQESSSTPKNEPLFSEDEILLIGLKISTPALRKKIEERVDDRLKNGALAEAEKLFEDYEKLPNQIKRANGYRQLFEYLLGNISLQEARYRWTISEYQHAKKQRTYFRKNKNIIWFETDKSGFKNDILKLVEHNFYSK